MALSKEAERLKNVKPENKSEQDYQAQWDAQALVQAEVIKADPVRLKLAKAWAELVVSKEKAEAEAYAKLASS